MNDPHVESLYYALATNESTDYAKAEPLEKEADDFRVIIDKKGATFYMKKHFATAAEAHAVVDPFVQKWEVIATLERSINEFNLVYKTTNIIDRNPLPDTGAVLQLAATDIIILGSRVAFIASRGKFPEPPSDFSLSPDAETLYIRYKGYMQGRETLTAMAYSCLTILTASAGNRDESAAKYNISMRILNRLANLCTEKGDKFEARKAPKDGQYIPLTHQERTWIESAVKIFIRRLGEWAYNPNAQLTQITMKDLPSI
ncbi:MAG: hypothetical protein HZA08_07775 [Nitrospirae bacterium]|nr:hypothetical protein [Nitrospirota bacterium]